MSQRKLLGQHFLINPSLTNKIVHFALPLTDCQVIEIGPGSGVLTESILMHQPQHLIVIEIDFQFLAHLQYLKEHYANTSTMTIIHDDALKVNLAQLVPFETAAHTKLITNLPYSKTSAILMQWLESIKLQQYILTIQKEYAQKLLASPNTKCYNSMTVLMQTYFQITKLLDIKAQAFSPPPKVDSMVIKLNPYNQSLPNFKEFAKFIQHAFKAPLRKIINNLSSYCYDVILPNPQARPRQISVAEFYQIFQSRVSKKI